MEMNASIRSLLITSLEKYGELGSNSLIDIITHCLNEMIGNQTPLVIPLPTCRKVSVHLLRLIDNYENVKLASSAWFILALLCDTPININAFEFASVLESLDVLRRVSKAITSLSADKDDIARECLRFLAIFAQPTSVKKAILLKTPEVIEVLLSSINTKFEYIPSFTKSVLLNSFINVISHKDAHVIRLADVLLKCDGFRVMNRTLQVVHTWALSPSADRALDPRVKVEIVTCCLLGAGNLWGVINTASAASPLSQPRSMYTFESPNVRQFTSLLCSYYSLSDEARFQEATVKSAINFIAYLQCLQPDVLETALLCTGDLPTATGADSIPFVVRFFRASQDARLHHLQETVRAQLKICCNMFPAVKDLIDRERLAGSSGSGCSGCSGGSGGSGGSIGSGGAPPRVLACALPGCFVSSNTNIVMQQCARCKQVTYCGREHQTLHWKVHKKFCRPSQK